MSRVDPPTCGFVTHVLDSLDLVVGSYRHYADRLSAAIHLHGHTSGVKAPAIFYEWSRKMLTMAARICNFYEARDGKAMVDSTWFFDSPGDFLERVFTPMIVPHRGSLPSTLAFLPAVNRRRLRRPLPDDAAKHSYFDVMRKVLGQPDIFTNMVTSQETKQWRHQRSTEQLSQLS